VSYRAKLALLTEKKNSDENNTVRR